MRKIYRESGVEGSRRTGKRKKERRGLGGSEGITKEREIHKERERREREIEIDR